MRLTDKVYILISLLSSILGIIVINKMYKYANITVDGILMYVLMIVLYILSVILMLFISVSLLNLIEHATLKDVVVVNEVEYRLDDNNIFIEENNVSSYNITTKTLNTHIEQILHINDEEYPLDSEYYCFKEVNAVKLLTYEALNVFGDKIRYQEFIIPNSLR